MILVIGAVIASAFSFIDSRLGQPAGSGANNFDPWRENWAQWTMAIAAMVATGTGFIGLLWIRQTLEATRLTAKAAIKSYKIARKIGQAQTRPYIVYESVKIGVIHFGQGLGTRMELDISFRNSGFSPGIVTATSCALFAPNGEGGWSSKGSSWRPMRVVIGQNQADKIRFHGIDAADGALFTWFTAGILVWYTGLDGAEYEEFVWLTYDGKGMRQDYPTNSKFALYRPEQ